MVLQEIRRYDDDFKVWHSAYTNMSSFAHWHEEVEPTWVHSGSVVITAEGRQHMAAEGDLILCGSGCVHGCDAKGMKNQLEFILFDPALVQGRLSPLNVRFLHITKQQLDDMNFVVYRNLLRLEKAVSLLQETTMTMSAIAFNCGFQDIRTFNRVFQQYTGHTPSDFRQDPQLGFQACLYPYRQGGPQLQVEGHSPVVSENLEPQ